MHFNTKNIVATLVGCLQLALLMGLSTSCANIQPPLGGPKDTLAPVLVEALPAPNSTEFTGNTIHFSFDEFVKIENVTENLIINPPAEKYPIINSKLRTVTIKIKDTLQPNTTYTYNFGNAIKDVNENNPFKDFSYSFSTGKYIDSLEIMGTITNAETGVADSTLLLLLHVSDDDSAIAKEKPRFVTRANGKGQFRFDHLPAGSFHIFALKDEGLKKYTSNAIPMAFYDRKVTTNPQDSIIELRYFVGEKEEERPKNAGANAARNNTKPTEKEIKEDKKMKYNVSAQSGQDLLEPMTITFNHPTANIDTSKIRLTDTLDMPVTGYYFTRDTLGKEIKLRSAWKEDFHYRLYLDKGFATDSLGVTTIKSDTLSFKSKAESEYGSVKIKFAGLDMARHPVLQWIEGDKITLSAKITGNEYNVKIFKPGQYKVRILYDANENGIWDTGNYWEKRQPEYVISIDQPLSVKASWENEFELNL